MENASPLRCTTNPIFQKLAMDNVLKELPGDDLTADAPEDEMDVDGVTSKALSQKRRHEETKKEKKSKKVKAAPKEDLSKMDVDSDEEGNISVPFDLPIKLKKDKKEKKEKKEKKVKKEKSK
jgi:hypothetical protein